METVALGIKGKHRLVFIGDREERHTADRLCAGCRKSFVQLPAGKGYFLRLRRFATHHAVALGIQICVSAPLQLFQVAGHEVAMRLSTGDQVMQRELFVLSHCRQRI